MTVGKDLGELIQPELWWNMHFKTLLLVFILSRTLHFKKWEIWLWFFSEEAPLSQDPFLQLFHGTVGSSENSTTLPSSGTFHVTASIRSPFLSLFPCPLSSYFQVTKPAFQSQSRCFQETHPSLTDWLCHHRVTGTFNCSSWHENKVYKDTCIFIIISLTSVLQKGKELCLTAEYCVLSMKYGSGMVTWWSSLTTNLLNERNTNNDCLAAANSLCYTLLRLWEDVELKLR